MYPDFNTIKQFHDWGISQDLDWYCEYGFITADQYKQLTGKDYDSNSNNQTTQNNQSNPNQNTNNNQ